MGDDRNPFGDKTGVDLEGEEEGRGRKDWRKEPGNEVFLLGHK